MRTLRSWLLVAVALAPLSTAHAWSSHTLCTWEALTPLPGIAGQVVRAESLERFVAAQAPQLERLLGEHEAWARDADGEEVSALDVVATPCMHSPMATPYWGWRFTGWALRYVQDLTQPYHATALHGVGLPRQLFLGLAAQLGFEGPKNAEIALVSNRHLVLETYQVKRMLRAMASGHKDDALLAALRDTRGDTDHWRYEAASTRPIVSREAHDSAAALDAQVAALLQRLGRHSRAQRACIGPGRAGETAMNPIECAAVLHDHHHRQAAQGGEAPEALG